MHRSTAERLLLIAMGSTLIAIGSHAQYLQLGPKLVSPAAIGAARQGGSVAVSGDGATIVVGGSHDDGEKGAAFVYERTGSTWSPATKLTAPDAIGNARQGWSVAIARDGNTIAVGGAHDNNSVGAVWVYTRSGGGGWDPPVKLVATDASGTGAKQGWSVALNADGTRLVTGGPFDGNTQPHDPTDAFHDGQNGAAWIWSYSAPGTWTALKLPYPADVSPSANLGSSVSISASGDVAVVGAPYDAADAGAAVVYALDAGGAWIPQPKLSASPADSQYGRSVAMSGDGQTVLVGAPFDPSNGAAWIHTRVGATWSAPVGLARMPSVPAATFGQSVSLDADGGTAVVGTPFVGSGPVQGGAWVFGLQSGGAWLQLGGPLEGSAGTGDAAQGWAVAISDDGQTVLSGGINDQGKIGAAWVFAQATNCPSVFFEPVGDLPGDCYYSLPSDISANGAYVSLSSAADEPYTTKDAGTCPSFVWPHSNEAAGWTRPCRHVPFFSPPLPGPGGLQALGYLPGSNAAHEESLAYGISPDGQVVVGMSNYGSLNRTKAVVFLPTLTRALGLAGGFHSAAAADISQQGAAAPGLFSGTPEISSAMSGRVIAGYVSATDQEPIKKPTTHAAYWTTWANAELLPHPASSELPNGITNVWSEAMCISDDGEWIGGRLYYDKAANPSHYMSIACAWKRNATAPPGTLLYDQVFVLEDLPGGDHNARITHISGDGLVLVGYGATATANPLCWDDPRTACKWIWNSATSTWSAPIPLTALNGSMFSAAHGTNADGSVIVGTCLTISDACTDPWFEDQAVAWIGGGTAQPPEVIAALLGAHVPAGWQLFEALGVSADGMTITGYAFDPDYNQIGWVVGRP